MGIRAGAFSNLGAALGGGGAMPDFSQLLGNPALMNMATQIMQDPNMQNLMSNIMSGTLNATTPQPNAAPAAGQGEGQGNNAAPGGGLNLDSLLRAYVFLVCYFNLSFHMFNGLNVFNYGLVSCV